MIACQHNSCRCIRVLQWNEDFLLHGLPGFIDQDIVLDLVDADALDLARTDAGGDRDVDVLYLLQLRLQETDLAVPEERVVLVVAEPFLLALLHDVEGEQVFGVPVGRVDAHHLQLVLVHELTQAGAKEV